MHANYNAISTNMQWNGYLQKCMTMQYDAIYWGKCNGCMQATMEMHDNAGDATAMIAAFPILPTGRYTRLVQYPELRRRHAASRYGASIQISSRGYTPGYLNQTLVSELPNLCALGISHSNSSFHRPSWSSRNSPQT